jgi:hypothetical protein
MTRSVQLIRLLTSVTIATASCWFVAAYDEFSRIRYTFDHRDFDGYRTESGEVVLSSQASGGAFIATHRNHAYAVPLVGLLFGFVVLWRWQTRHALIELIISAMWVLGLVWAGFALVMWQMQNIPLFHGMRWHY